MLIARLDGGCWKNPGGPGASACLITRDGKEVFSDCKLLPENPKMTNNVAEFEGLKMILEWCLKDGSDERIHIISDSQILINRITGKSRKPPVGSCAAIAKECVALCYKLKRKLSAEWQSRLTNDECDAMCTRKMRDHMKTSRVPSYMSDDRPRYGDEVL